MKYKGYTIKTDPTTKVNGKPCMGVFNDAGLIMDFFSTKEAKEWVYEHPVSDYEVYYIVGENAAIELFDWEGVKELRKAMRRENIVCDPCRKSFTSTDCLQAFLDGISACEGYYESEHIRVLTREEYLYLMK